MLIFPHIALFAAYQWWCSCAFNTLQQLVFQRELWTCDSSRSCLVLTVLVLFYAAPFPAPLRWHCLISGPRGHSWWAHIWTNKLVPTYQKGIVFYRGVSEGVKEALCLLSKTQLTACPASSGFQGTDRPGSYPHWVGSGNHYLWTPVITHFPVHLIFFFSNFPKLVSFYQVHHFSAPLSFIDCERFCNNAWKLLCEFETNPLKITEEDFAASTCSDVISLAQQVAATSSFWIQSSHTAGIFTMLHRIPQRSESGS